MPDQQSRTEHRPRIADRRRVSNNVVFTGGFGNHFGPLEVENIFLPIPRNP
jgi:hypothetical protein